MRDEDLPDWAAELEASGGTSGSGQGRKKKGGGAASGTGSGGSAGGGRRRGRGLLLGFLLGAAAGVAGTLYLPDLLAPWLPPGLRGELQTVEGLVLEEKREQDGRLLLTVETGRGAVLATFNERVAEIELLVGEGDTVALGLDRYRPFVTDPAIEGVRKVRRSPMGGAGAAAGSGPGTGGEEAAGSSREEGGGTPGRAAGEDSAPARDSAAAPPAEPDTSSRGERP